VVDGVIVNEIADIDPVMVKSIEVLKGPDASVYGTRGSNGVIVITRKTGIE
jgi:TonB-dependent SusC/RagA subfamily outer membrane receptor